MTAEEREKLHDLFRAAMNAEAYAACELTPREEVQAADDAFLQALYAIEVTP